MKTSAVAARVAVCAAMLLAAPGALLGHGPRRSAPPVSTSAPPAAEASVDAAASAAPVKQKYVPYPGERFALDLLGAVVEKEGLDRNLALSPFSAGVALSMLREGAAGGTREALVKTLRGAEFAGVGKSADTSVVVYSANSVWLAEGVGLKPRYRSTLEDEFGAQCFTRPFDNSTVAEINRWCSDHTNGMIPSILGQLSPAMRMVLVNALYFKGAWEKKFTPEPGGRHVFNGTRGQTTPPFMRQSSRLWHYADPEGWTAVRIPYKGGGTYMVVVMPPASMPLERLKDELGPERFSKILQGWVPRDVRLSMPKFKTSSSLELKETLCLLGAGPVFEDGADFTPMTGGSLCVDRVVQKCVVDVTEEGTEAAAVTAVTMRPTSVAQTRWTEMTVDRPFVYMLYDTRTHDVLFEGVVANL